MLHDLAERSSAERTLDAKHDRLRSDFVLDSPSSVKEEFVTSRLAVTIHLSKAAVRNSGEAVAGVQLSINGKTSNLIDLKAAGNKVQYFYTGLLTGSQRTVTSDLVVRVDFENYAQLGALRAGQNAVELKLWQDSSSLVESAVVDARSGVSYFDLKKSPRGGG